MTVLNHTGRSNEKLVYYDPYIFFFKILSLSNYRERVAICYRERVAIYKKKKKKKKKIFF